MALNQTQFKSDLYSGLYDTLKPVFYNEAGGVPVSGTILFSAIETNFATLTEDEKAAIKASLNTQAEVWANKLSDSISAVISDLITPYIQSADIIGVATTDTVVVPPGVMVATAGTPTAQIGATTSSGTGTGTGTQSNIVHPI
jgi:hypothetical protein